MPTKLRKPPIDPVRWRPPPVDALPDPPARPVTIVPVGGMGPEDVVVDAEGQLWTGLVDGRIVRISPDDGEYSVVADTGGRPLGLHVARDGRVLICDCDRGLLALDPSSGVLSTLATSVDGRPLGFCSNVTETADGTIYFTESTSADFGFENFLGPFLEARGRGGLFRLDADGTVTTLVSGLYFTNGVTVTADGSALVFAETMGRRLSKYWLTGPLAGTVTPLAVHLPGMPDNISTGSDGRIWTAMVTPVNTAAESLMPRAPWLRKLVWRLPARLHPKIAPEIWVIGFDPDSGSAVGGIRTTHPDFGAVTGVVESGGRLWMSTIEFPALAYYEL
ncbi:SMP-30/gluconolactonase/LRE family protein [Mycolicibacterium sp. YH-1]|uniref:SMP-30/gluconolactonase/LRE family protein n=1 Tax=Mycolicibacterium sp. YH-1 TaxID=2908837 RepID=UPI001F4BD6D5|nr:SMP-30/gluconolactonase/LRE family protein [Mycolicibacterium sp. YH-1]UNB51130.1 SMP-30/gluconolactonase/LRE family protein [Mycolicibacterium sp. YH-1]